MSIAQVRRLIDGRGMPYPGPLMALIKEIHEGEPGAAFEVLVSDPESERDIPAWLRKAGQELLDTFRDTDYTGYVVRKVA
jgi:TusA-related sulfurtransferase